MRSKLPEGWKVRALGELSTIRRGASPRPINKYIANSGIPWVKIADATASNSRYINSTKEYIIEEVRNKSVFLETGTLILSNSATPGLPKIMGIEGCVHDGWLVLTDFKDLNKLYLYYMLLDIRRRLVNLSDGSVFKNLNIGIVSNFKINVPKLEEQKVIADTLSSLDDKIELNNKINENLEQQAQAIFKHWFIDFEFPDKNGNPYKSSGGQMIDSELGMIPKGWEVVELSEISVVQNGFAFKSKDYISKGCPVIRTLNIENNFVNNNNLEYLSIEFYEDDKYKKYALNKFDTLLVMVGATIGKMGMILDNNIPSLQNQNMWRFRPLNENISPFFLYLYVYKINQDVSGWDSGSARSFYRKGIFQDAKVILPSVEIMKSFNDITLNMYNMININRQQNEKLSKLIDTLLPKLMSGEVRIPLD